MDIHFLVKTMRTFFLSLLLFCTSLSFGDVQIIAHRGNSSKAPENTLAAFRSAKELKVDFIECDIHLTQDHIPVVIHNRELFRTTDSTHSITVDHIPLSELNTYDAGYWFSQQFKGERVPTLVDLLECDLDQIGLMIELKPGSAPDSVIAEKVMQVIQNYPSREIRVGSKSASLLRQVKKIAPNQFTIAIVEEMDDFREHQQIHPDMYAFQYTLVNDEIVRNVHDQGKVIWVWTVNNPNEADKLIKMGVDGLITNRPKEMLRKRNSSLEIQLKN